MTLTGSNSSLNETGFNIVRRNFNQGNTIGIISAFSQGEETNLTDAAMPKTLLKEAARRLHFGFAEFSGRWTENDDASGSEVLPESGYIVFGSPDNNASVWKLLKLFDIKYGPKRFLLITEGEALRNYAHNYDCQETFGPFNCTQDEFQNIYTAFYRTKRFAKDRRNKYSLGFVLESLTGCFPVRPFLPSFADGREYHQALTRLDSYREPPLGKRNWTEEIRSELSRSIDQLFAYTGPDSEESLRKNAESFCFGIIGAFRPDHTPEENSGRSAYLEEITDRLCFAFDRIRGYCPDSETPEAEDDFIVYAESWRKNDKTELQNYLVSAVREFGQEAALFVSGGQACLLYGDGRRESLGAFSCSDPEAMADMLSKAKKRLFRLGEPGSASAGEPFSGCVIKTKPALLRSWFHAVGYDLYRKTLQKHKDNFFKNINS